MRDYSNFDSKTIEIELERLDTGSVVYIDPRYDWTENKSGKKFFVSVLSSGSVLLADTKKMAVQDHSGYIYSICDVVRF